MQVQGTRSVREERGIDRPALVAEPISALAARAYKASDRKGYLKSEAAMRSAKQGTSAAAWSVGSTLAPA